MGTSVGEGVSVGGTGVAVGGTGVAVGGTGVSGGSVGSSTIEDSVGSTVTAGVTTQANITPASPKTSSNHQDLRFI